MRKFFDREGLHLPLVLAGLFAVLNRIWFSEHGNNITVDGHMLYCHRERLPIYKKVLEVFVKLVPKYFGLKSEEYYLQDRLWHARYLRNVASIVLCACYAAHPFMLGHRNSENVNELDLTYMPQWVKRIIKKVIIRANHGLTCVYYGYSKIAEE